MFRQENRGLSATRNRGVDISCGKFIAFLDADDKLMPHFVKSIFSVVISNSVVDIVEFNMVKSDGTFLNICVGNDDLIQKFKNGKWYACARVYNKELLNCGFVIGIYYEDIFLIPDLYLKSRKNIEINEVLYWYRVNQESITNCKSISVVEKSIKSFEVVLDKYRQTEMDVCLRSIVYYHVLYLSVIYILQNRSLYQSLQFLRKHHQTVRLKCLMCFRIKQILFIFFSRIYLVVFFILKRA